MGTNKSNNFDILELIRGLLPSATYSFDYRKPAKAESTPQPTASPQAMAQQIAGEAGDFKFSMGKDNYDELRPQIESLLKDKQSPLLPYIDEFIKAGNKHKIDPRVLVSIANNESSLGKSYPPESHNPFGYLVKPEGQAPPKNNDEKYKQIVQGLYGAGFESLPHAIDALTGRFARQPFEGYKTFAKDPTFSNLQQAYNANPAERNEQMKNFSDIERYFR